MMNAERLALSPLLSSHGAKQLQSLAAKINKGAVFVYPTETIYGIGASCAAPGSREAVVKAKSRTPENPMILLAASRENFSSLDLTFPPAAESLARAFWPGLLTLVVPSKTVPEGIAIRVSDHPFITSIFRFLDSPVYSTSANLSDEPYVNDSDLIYSKFSERVDFMIDAGTLPQSLPSNVVKVTIDNEVIIIREGTIVKEEVLERVKGEG